MANELRLRQNFLGGSVDADLTLGGTVLTSGALGGMIVVDGTSHIPLVLDPDGTHGEPEIVYVVSHTTTAGTAQILRGQEGTAAREHLRDTPWVHGQVASDFQLPTPKTVTSGYVMTASDMIIFANGTFTVTLPTVVTTGRRYSVKNIGAGTITVAPHTGGLIDGLPNFTLPGQYDAIDAVRDGADWWLL